ncbi:MAG: hypothetical protein OJF51_003653 [Nitrospira sp.]|nr:MAG: hypothetical protein OJF51_003653 [Nitrospira sp.]
MKFQARSFLIVHQFLLGTPPNLAIPSISMLRILTGSCTGPRAAENLSLLTITWMVFSF